jgi:hypothetical protein
MRLRKSKIGFTAWASRADDEPHNIGFEDPIALRGGGGASAGPASAEWEIGRGQLLPLRCS